MPDDRSPTPARRVLVVDDNQDSRNALTLMLRELGCVVSTARDGSSALVCADEFRPELVLIDILMPGLNGLQLAQKLRGHPSLSRVKLVSMSGFPVETSDLLWQRSGCDDHLSKPVTFARLEQLIKEA